jgi:radical SAM superfamily enzyme YgiQ (UPF0313 family)
MQTRENRPVDALLIGYEKQENLGLRSIVSFLDAQGYRAVLLPFHPDHEDTVASLVQQYRPRLVGFSLIFQYTLEEFGSLMRNLRARNIGAHFTAGGHFPSLCPEETFRVLPELDTIVRFEGELTITELLGNLDRPDAWPAITGLAFRKDGKVILNETRPLITDLDSLPPLHRDEPVSMSFDISMASMLASRGCLFNCSFCSIRQFYGGTAGKLRRIRSPKAVIDEMKHLYSKMNVRFFSFQDDDFAARTQQQRSWLRAFLNEFDKSSIAGRVRWKISCRVDDLEASMLEMMIDRGLAAVYLGVESGNEAGLRELNKRTGVAENLKAIELLKQYRVAMAIGFMLFDPSSTIASVRENIGFLRTVGSDGYFPVNFCKMLPYGGTPIESKLRAEGRLKGSIARPDYGFLDPRLDWYEFLVQQVFSRRNFSPEGNVVLLQNADFDLRLTKSFGFDHFTQEAENGLREAIRKSNLQTAGTLDSLLDDILDRGIENILEEQQGFMNLCEQQWIGEMNTEIELKKLGFTNNGKNTPVSCKTEPEVL